MYKRNKLVRTITMLNMARAIGLAKTRCLTVEFKRYDGY